MTEENKAVPADESNAAPTEESKAATKGMEWYAVHALSGYEEKAKKYLLYRIKEFAKEAFFGDIVVPTETVAEVVEGKKRNTTRRAMPGYIFVQMVLDEETWHIVRETEKITGFVGNSRQPRPMRKKEVDKIHKQAAEGAQAVKPVVTFDVGMSVRIVDGPFASFVGQVDEVKPERQKLRVLVTIFGRATPVELDFMQVEKT